MCLDCVRDGSGHDDVGEVSTSEVVAGDFVSGIDALSDSEDDLVTAEYRGRRDVDGWQRRDPWGGSAGDVPNRASTRTFISTPTSPSHILSSPTYTPSFTGSSTGFSID